MPWTWNREDAAHLLRRTSFGGTLDDVEMLYAAGRERAIDYVLNFERIPDPVWDDPNPLRLANPLTDTGAAKLNFLYRLVVSPRALQSRLIWFWHGHFTSSLSLVGGELMWRQLRTWRVYARGNFLQFLFAMQKDGAMLRYLHGDENSKVHPNEDFSRECMELFTCGPGLYGERDVREAARAFTGCRVSPTDGAVTFDNQLHDYGSKTILGQTGNFVANDVLRMLFDLPETSRRICTKLYRAFVNDKVNALEVNNLIRVWQETPGDLHRVMHSLLHSVAFWHPANRGSIMKGGLEYVIGLFQRLELPPRADLIERIAKDSRALGQSAFNPPNVAGYAAGLRQAGTSMLLTRYQFSYDIIYRTDPDGVTNRMAGDLPLKVSNENLMATLAQRLGLGAIMPATQVAIRQYLSNSYFDPRTLRDRTLGTLFLLACSPEFQIT